MNKPTDTNGISSKPPKIPDINQALKEGLRPNFSKGEDWSKHTNEPANDNSTNWEERLARTKEGTVKSLLSNVVRILQHDPRWKGAFSLDTFSQKILWKRSPPKEWSFSQQPSPNSIYRETDSHRLAVWLSDAYQVEVSPSTVMEAIKAVAEEHQQHPVRFFLKRLAWDQKPRLDTWLPRLLGTQDNAYTRSVGAKWMISAIARIMSPGAKADCMLILEGVQGILKSTTLKLLAGEEWFLDHLGELGSKDTSQQLQGRWIIEFAELDHFDRTAITRIKSFLSQTEDSFRPPYGRQVETYKRQCIFAGSCNSSEYLRDETGGRRFWPVRCTLINLNAVKAERDQLWAEAFARYQRGEKWWLEGDVLTEALAEQSARYQGDPWEEPIAHWLKEKPYVTMGEVLRCCLDISEGKQERSHQMRISAILRRLGWERRHVAGVWRYEPKRG